MEEKGPIGAEYDITDNPHEGMAADPPAQLPSLTITIPPEVREEVAKAIYEHWNAVLNNGPPWEQVDDDWRTGTLGQAEAAIVALFETWPGIWHWPDPADGRAIVLPVTTENSND